MPPPMMPYEGMLPDDVAMARQYGQQLMQQGTSTAPVGHWTQALARALQGASGAGWMADASQGQRQGQGQANQLLAQALQGGDLKSIGTQALSNPWTAPLGTQLALKALTPEQTNAQKDYAAALKGGFKGSFMDYQTGLRAAGRPQTTVDMRGENEEAKQLGKSSAEMQTKLYERAAASGDQMRQLAQVQANLERVRTGPTAGIVKQGAAWARDLGVSPQFLESIGIPKDFVGDANSLQSITSRMLVDLIGKGGFPANNFSNADRQFLEQTLPQLVTDPRGNRIIVESAKRAAQANIEKARAWRAVKQADPKASYMDFDIDYSSKVANRFDDLVKESRALLERSAQGFQPAPTAPPGPVPAGGAGRFAPPQQNAPVGAIIEGLRRKLQSGEIKLPDVIEDARRTIQANPAARDEVLRRLQALNIPAEGI